MSRRLLFLDCETTGLDETTDVLLEVGMVVVELPTFEPVAEQNHVMHFELKPTLTKDHHFKGPGRELFIHKNVVQMHQKNGLWDACKRSQLNDYQKLDNLVRQFIVDNGCDGSELAGAGVSFDQRWLKKLLPITAQGLHYRIFDTNAFWLLQSYITGQEATRDKGNAHRAIDDCKDAIGEVEKFFDFFQKLVGGG